MLFFRDRGVAQQIAAGKRHELQLVLAKEIAHGGGTAKLRNAVGPQLYAAKTNRGDVVDGLAIVAAPGDGSVAVVDFGRRRCDERVKVREVHWRIKAVRGAKSAVLHGNAEAAAKALIAPRNSRRGMRCVMDPTASLRSANRNASDDRTTTG